MSFTRRTAVISTNPEGTPSVTQLAPEAGTYNQAAGDLIAVLVKWEGTNGTCSVTDVAGNTYTALTRASNLTNQEHSQVFYVLSCLGSAVNVVTATFSSAAIYRNVTVLPYLPGAAASFVAENSGTGTGTAVASGSFNAGTLAVAACSEFAGTTTTAGSGWSEQSDQSTNGSHDFDRIDAPGGTITATCTLATSADWQIAGASFTDVAGGDVLIAQICM